MNVPTINIYYVGTHEKDNDNNWPMVFRVEGDDRDIIVKGFQVNVEYLNIFFFLN